MENSIARSPGHCMTMGTASTMTSATEALGFTLPGAASIPGGRLASRADGERDGPAHRRHGLGGLEAVRHRDGRRSIDNAIVAVLALGGSTNAVVHLVAIARRAGVAAHARPLRRALPQDAARRQRAAGGQVPDGGFLLRRRLARAARVDRRSARRSTRGRRTAARSARTSPARKCSIPTSSSRARRRSSQTAASRCCAATSRPTAR